MVGSLHVLAGEVWLSITSHQQKFFLETVFQANDPLKEKQFNVAVFDDR